MGSTSTDLPPSVLRAIQEAILPFGPTWSYLKTSADGLCILVDIAHFDDFVTLRRALKEINVTVVYAFRRDQSRNGYQEQLKLILPTTMGPLSTFHLRATVSPVCH